jgi:hypothetical protein
MIWPITGRSVWNITFFFTYFDLIMNIDNFLSMSFTILCCSRNSYVLWIARYNGCITNESIPENARSKACLCAARLLYLGVRITPTTCKSDYCDCCVLSGRGLSVRLITCPEENYSVWCAWVVSSSSVKGESMTGIGVEGTQKETEISVIDVLNVK